MVLGSVMRRVGWFALLASLWPGVGLAQTLILEGRVTDPLGGTINGALVTLTSPGTTAARTTRTGVDGTFAFDSVPAGSVTVNVEAPGFERVDADGFADGDHGATVDGAEGRGNRRERGRSRAETGRGIAADHREQRCALEDDHGRGDPERRLLRRGSGAPGARPRFVPDAAVRTVRLRHRIAPGFAYQRNPVAGRWRPHQQSPLQRHDAARHDPRPHGGADRDPRRRPGALLRHTGGGRHHQCGDEGVHRRQGRRDSGRWKYQPGRFHQWTGPRQRPGQSLHRLRFDRRCQGYQNFSDDQYQPSTTDRNRSYNVHTFGGKYAYDFSRQLRLSTAYQFTNAARLDGLRPGRSSATQSGGPANIFNERKENIFSAKLDFKPRETAEFFLKTYYHQWDSHYTEERNSISQPGSVGRHQRPGVLGLQGLRCELSREADADTRSRVLRGLRLPELLGPGRRAAHRAEQRDRERPVRADPDDPRSHEERTSDRGCPLQRSEREREPHGLERDRPVQPSEGALRARHGRHVVPVSRCLRALRDRSDLLLRQSEPEAGVEHELQRLVRRPHPERRDHDRSRVHRLLPQGSTISSSIPTTPTEAATRSPPTAPTPCASTGSRSWARRR